MFDEEGRENTEREYIDVSTMSVWVDEEAREGAVFVDVSAVYFAPVQLYTHFVPNIQVQDHTVGGVVVVLICILSDCTGSHLQQRQKKKAMLTDCKGGKE